MTARLDVLCAGYAAERVASTVVLIRDEDAVIVVDPGMVADRSLILGPLPRALPGTLAAGGRRAAGAGRRLPAGGCHGV